MCTVMEVFMFICDVRARGDALLQSLNSDCRRALTAVECRSVAQTVVRECRMEPDWKRVPDEAVKIVSTKAAEMQVVEEFLIGRVTQSYRAVDYVQNEAIWERATDRVTRALNRTCYGYEYFKLYVGAVVRMTYNRRDETDTIYSQGQLAVVISLPEDSSGEFSKQRIRLRLAPPGFVTFACSQGQDHRGQGRGHPRGQAQDSQGQGHDLLSSRILEAKACPRGLHHWILVGLGSGLWLVQVFA